MTKLMAALVFVFSTACGGGGKPEPAAPSDEKAAAPAPAAAEACEDGFTIWDATAGACRLFPGGPYGKAGCSERETTAPEAGCMTGTHWDNHCDCECDAGAWNESTHACG